VSCTLLRHHRGDELTVTLRCSDGFYGSFHFPYLCYFYKRYKNCEQTIILSLRKVFSFKTTVTHLLYLSLNFSTPFPFFNLCINSLPFFLLNIIKKYKHFCFAISLISPSLRFLFNCLALFLLAFNHLKASLRIKISFYRFKWKSQSQENTHLTTCNSIGWPD